MVNSKMIRSVTEASHNFSELLADADAMPIAIKRKQDVYFIMNAKQITPSVPFTLVLNTNDPEPFAYFSEIPGAYGVGANFEEMIQDMVVALTGYVEVYLDCFQESVADQLHRKRLLQVMVLHTMSKLDIELLIKGKLKEICKTAEQ